MSTNLNDNNGVNFSPSQLVIQFNKIMDQTSNSNNNHELLEKANTIAEEIISITSQTYESSWERYKEVRGNNLKEIDVICWNTLNRYIDKYICKEKRDINILDVGTGNGRDLIHGQSLGYNTIGIDNCNGFIELLSEYCSEGLITKDSYKKCDMRDLDFPDQYFDVVRHNATLLHMPIIGPGYTVDKCLEESHRVLKKDGLIYIFVKTGTSLEMFDTNENLGGRIFQFFSHKTLNEVVIRNGFTILHSSDEVEIRGKDTIDWILLIAQK